MGTSRGWIKPYSGRGAYSNSTSTAPSRQRTRRITTPGEPAPMSCPRSRFPNAIASTSDSVPVVVWNTVSNTIVSSTYPRLTSASATGPMRQCPAASSRSRPNTAGPSKRPAHSQSMEPSRLTSAAEWQSEMSA